MVERKRRPDMGPRRLQGHHCLALSARMLEREAGIAEGDLVLLPGDVARKFTVTDPARGRRLLPHPRQQRGNRMSLGRQLALPAQARAREQAAIEARGKGFGVEGNHETRRALLAEVGHRGDFETEIDGLLFPLELARSGQRCRQGRHAEICRYAIDASRLALLVVNDVDGSVLDAHVPEPDVAALLRVSDRPLWLFSAFSAPLASFPRRAGPSAPAAPARCVRHRRCG